jgi:hypothetical protein
MKRGTRVMHGRVLAVAEELRTHLRYCAAALGGLGGGWAAAPAHCWDPFCGVGFALSSHRRRLPCA